MVARCLDSIIRSKALEKGPRIYTKCGGKGYEECYGVVLLHSYQAGIGICGRFGDGVVLLKDKTGHGGESESGCWAPLLFLKWRAMGFGGYGAASSDHVIFLESDDDVKKWTRPDGRVSLSGELHTGALDHGGGLIARRRGFRGFGKQAAGLYLSSSLLIKSVSLDHERNRALYGRHVDISDVREGRIRMPETDEVKAVYAKVTAAASRFGRKDSSEAAGDAGVDENCSSGPLGSNATGPASLRLSGCDADVYAAPGEKNSKVSSSSLV